MHIFGKWRQAGMIGGDKTTRKELCLENLEKRIWFYHNETHKIIDFKISEI